MTLGVRTKLSLISLAILATVGTTSGIFLEARLRTSLEATIEAEVLRHAKTVRDLIEEVPGSSNNTFDRLADRLGESTGMRVTIIAADGEVLGDSSLTLAEVWHRPWPVHCP